VRLLNPNAASRKRGNVVERRRIDWLERPLRRENVVCPPAKEVTDPAASVPDTSQFPLTNSDSAAPAERNLEVLRGLSELDWAAAGTGLRTCSSSSHFRCAGRGWAQHLSPDV
jgi:hypothetical protein